MNKRAFLFGINEYNDPIAKLKYARQDAEAVAKVLRNSYGFQENEIMLATCGTSFKPAGKFDILGAIRWEEVLDLLLLGFWGHSFWRDGKRYLLPVGARLDHLNETAVTLDELYDAIRKIPAKNVCIFLDCCQGRVEAARDVASPELEKELQKYAREQLQKRFSPRPGQTVAILNSCSEEQKAYEWDEKHHGLFTVHLLEALTLAKTDVKDIFAHVQTQMRRSTASLQKIQTPFLTYEGEPDAEMILPAAPVSAQTPPSVLSPRAGTRMVKIIDGVEYAFRWCPAGEFEMGCSDSDATPHQVKLTRGFWMLETQTTQKMWQSVMGSNPSNWIGDKLPVECVSWDDCQEFCKKLRAKGLNVQLPTEAQWEYACRAGTTGDYAGNLDEMAWYNSNSGWGTHEVGLKKPNEWGLYDMHGNVSEWCSDWYDSEYYSKSPTNDPTGPISRSERVNRGGGWLFAAECCRSAYRDYDSPDSRYIVLGFRIVLVPNPEK